MARPKPRIAVLSMASRNVTCWSTYRSQAVEGLSENEWMNDTKGQQIHPRVEVELPVVDASTCREGGTISKHAKFWKNRMGHIGARNQERLCWWEIAAIYWTALEARQLQSWGVSWQLEQWISCETVTSWQEHEHKLRNLHCLET
jgi:hypothetical protein